MIDTYAIIDAAHGHLVNTVLWDGDTSKWQPPAGTTAVLLADIDLAALPAAPADETSTFTAEQIVSQYFSAYQIAALQRLEMVLLQAGKPLGPAMTAAKTWLENIMLSWAMNPVAQPASAFGVPSVTFEQASAEAIATIDTPPSL